MSLHKAGICTCLTAGRAVDFIAMAFDDERHILLESSTEAQLAQPLLTYVHAADAALMFAMGVYISSFLPC